ncbi:hypothetical protein ACFS32_09360 [Novosphingobium pokkalii]|uniref:hypothetical protein n=1 Tax=Novosphingobium pokkalii TaxID=1770194 RepID=UPI00363ADE2F
MARPATYHSAKGMMRAIVLNMGDEGRSVTDARYDSLFRGGDATQGVVQVIRAGRFFINGIAMPATAEDFAKTSPDGYLVNQVAWLKRDAATGAWKGGFKAEKPAASYESAALASATGIVAGLEVRLYDTDHDGFADRIEAEYKEGVAVGKVLRRRNGMFSVRRADQGVGQAAGAATGEGRAFDSAHFTATSGEAIKPAHFDRTLHPGDVALFWYGPDGWVMQRALQVRGAFMGGEDHKNYNIDGKIYQDAMRFSRDGIAISNRPGEFVNAQKFFGFDKDQRGAKTSLWLVPTTQAGKQGAPVALTSGTDAAQFLSRAIAVAKAHLSAAKVSVDGRDVPSTGTWASGQAHAQLASVIAGAQAQLAKGDPTGAALDYQTYLLYLALDGSDKDIGARFGGFRFTGFDHEVKAGLQGAS